MDTRRLRIGTTAAAVLFTLAATASCGGGGDGATGPAGGTGRRGAPTPAVTSAPPTHRPTSAPSTTSTTSATSATSTTRATSTTPRTTAPPAHTDASACFDGSCEITVTKPTTIRVDADRFGFPSFKITRVAASGVTIEAESGGTFLQSGVSPGGTAGLNDLKVRLKSVHNGIADLVLSHAS